MTPSPAEVPTEREQTRPKEPARARLEEAVRRMTRVDVIERNKENNNIECVYARAYDLPHEMSHRSRLAKNSQLALGPHVWINRPRQRVSTTAVVTGEPSMAD